MRAEAGVAVRRRRPARTGGRRERLVRAGRIALAVLAALLLLALAVGVVFAGSADRIAAGVSVAGVSVGGLTAAEATETLETRAASLADVPVVFTAGDRQFRVRPAALDVRAGWAAAAEEAVDRGDWPLPVRGLQRVWLRLSGAEVEPAVEAYDAAVAFRVDKLASRIDRPAREGALVLRDLEPHVVPGEAGRRLDQEAAAAVIVRALGGFEREETPLPVAVEAPRVTPALLRPVAEQVRTALSGPVDLRYSGATMRLEPEQTARLLLLPSGGATALAIKQEEAARRFRNFARGLAREPRNADFAVRANGRVRIVPSRPGRRLDVAATSAAFLEAATRATERSAEVVVSLAQPEVTTREARALGVERELASYATLYSGTADRIQNLQRAIELLDGARIAPGDVWSFNEHVGPRTAERGFRSAPVIIDGEYEEGIGGGVSQVATTIFNAAWEAGIKIAERTAHALYIDRYPTGRDATVNYPDVDLKLRNDTRSWIVLKASSGETGILVQLLGGGPVRRVESIPGELEVTGPPKVERIPDPTLYEDQRVVVDAGEPSREVRVERIVYQGGDVLYRESWYTGYRSEKKIVRVGTKPRPAEPAPPPEDDKPKDEDGPPGQGRARR
ncbi:MAG TPA: VanW family protein [Gaiellaceae bacterium]|nr:VanW family protein [Gaiellaceae bacterium]